jgi:hypothetical protein
MIVAAEVESTSSAVVVAVVESAVDIVAVVEADAEAAVALATVAVAAVVVVDVVARSQPEACPTMPVGSDPSRQSVVCCSTGSFIFIPTRKLR